VYSLGATIFHMMTGSDPQDNPLLIFDFSKNPRPSQINPSITSEMERILMKMVAHKPEDRYLNSLELMRGLEEHSARLDSRPKADPARPSSPYSRFTPPVEKGLALSPNMAEPRDSRGNQPALQPTPSGPTTGGGTGLDWVFCGHCGEKIGAEDVYCAHCGSRQPSPGSGASVGLGVAPLGAARITAQLYIVGTSDMVKPFTIDKESVLIGRTDPHTGIFPEIDLTMYDPETKVSRRHARIYRQGEQFLIEDLGSVNGTIVNSISGGSVRLNTKSPRVLSAGDEVKLGGTTLKFTMV
jgi:serine/threonine-protein kinase